MTSNIDSLASSSSKATSANYSDEATVGDIVGVATGTNAGLIMKSSFFGQLYEARSLAVSALPAAMATMDDDRGQTKRSIKRQWWQRR
jgi:hypothetical protein